MKGISKYSSGSIRQLEEEVIKRFGISHIEFRSRLRIGSNARQVMFYLLNEHFLYSSNQIGRMYGRDHSTVLSGIKKVSSNNVLSKQADELFLKCLQAVDNGMDNAGINVGQPTHIEINPLVIPTDVPKRNRSKTHKTSRK